MLRQLRMRRSGDSWKIETVGSERRILDVSRTLVQARLRERWPGFDLNGTPSMSGPHIGIVMPVFNEQECLPRLRERLRPVLDGLAGSYDVYLVDDGSTDGTSDCIRNFAREDKRWHGVFLARNFGHQAAITAGLRVVRGEVIVVMDSDLQDEPEAIPKLLEQYDLGYDTVYAVRANRKEGVFLRLGYWLFYRLLNSMSPQRVPLDAGDFCLMSRRVVDVLNALPENSRFVRGLRAWVGFRQIGIEVARNARAAGKPKYTFAKLVRLAIDGMLDFSWIPLRVVSMAGFLSMAAGLCYLLIILVIYGLGRIHVTGWMTLIFLVIWFGGMTLTSLGVIGEYLGRTFAEVKGRPAYIVASTTDDPYLPRDILITRSAASKTLSTVARRFEDTVEIAGHDT